jgi:hypothetical protein
MRVVSAVAAVVILMLSVVVPLHVAAQEEPGHILLTVRFCAGVGPGAAVIGTFSDVPCGPFGNSGYDTYMEIRLDGGEFLNGDGGSTLTLPFAPILDGNLYLAPGDYTLTITSEHPTGPLVSSIDLHVVAGETLPVTYTVTYHFTVGAESPPVPVDNMPEMPVEQPGTPIAVTEIPAEDAAIATEPALTDLAEVSETDSRTWPSVPTVITTLPTTGAGHVRSHGELALVSMLLTTLGTATGAVALRIRRT